MDPFSLTLGIGTILNVAVGIGKFLVDINFAAKVIDEEIASLIAEINALNATLREVEVLINNHVERPAHSPLQAAFRDPDHTKRLWLEAGETLTATTICVRKLDVLLKAVFGNETHARGKFDGIKKALKRKAKDQEYVMLRGQLGTFQRTLNMWLTMMNLTYIQQAESTSKAGFGKIGHEVSMLRSEMGLLRNQLRFQSDDLRSFALASETINLSRALDTANATLSIASLNEHFDVPASVDSLFTGRSALLNELKTTGLRTFSKGHNGQKRLVICGSGGSGKTQFCCKLAEEWREDFWGVFWIDASSDGRARHALSRISEDFAKKEPNERAAKSWLANHKAPWLLIIDSADKPDLPIPEYFPEGDRGFVIITTRNIDFRTLGNLRPNSWHDLGGLQEEEAIVLLLRAADEPEPWSVEVEQSARAIVKELDFLPRAITHAGATIRRGHCSLTTYCEDYQNNWRKLRRRRSLSASIDMESEFPIFKSCETSLQGLDTDAMDLLKMLSFFHYENIRFDIFTKGAINHAKEKEEVQKENIVKTTLGRKSPESGWLPTLWSNMRLFGKLILLHDFTPDSLPTLLRCDPITGDLDQAKLRKTLDTLTRMSLLKYNKATDSYSLHGLDSQWIRKRPAMSNAEQAVWCEAAAVVLARAISLPPHGEDQEAFRRDLLPHVDQLAKFEEENRKAFECNRKAQRPWCSVYRRPFGRKDALRAVKFSRIYAQCGKWEEAEKLQIIVKDFVSAAFGDEHLSSIRIRLFLSETYWRLGRGHDAAELQAQALRASTKLLGKNDPLTLRVMDLLGESRWMQGKLTESLRLHTEASEGMKENLPASRLDFLKAIDHLGRVHFKYLRCDLAKELHTQAVEGMQQLELNERKDRPVKEQKLTLWHADTLTAMQNLAESHLAVSKPNLDEAHAMITEVVSVREKILGEEHPFTLWAKCGLARIDSARGNHETAEHALRAGFLVAARDLGENHIGVLYARLYHAEVLTRQHRYDEAEEEFLDILERYKVMGSASGGDHPDRVQALLSLGNCYVQQEKVAKAVARYENAIQALLNLGGHEHPLTVKIRRELEGLRQIHAHKSGGLDRTAAEPILG